MIPAGPRKLLLHNQISTPLPVFYNSIDDWHGNC